MKLGTNAPEAVADTPRSDTADARTSATRVDDAMDGAATGARVAELMAFGAGVEEPRVKQCCTAPMERLQRHELSAVLPDMSKDEYLALRDSIDSEGLRFPIKLLDGQVLDGWHRYRACLDLMMAPVFEQFPEDEDPRRFVEATNLARRNLTRGQRAFAKAAIYAYAWAPKGGDRAKRGESVTMTDSPVKEWTAAQMAVEASVGVRTIEAAKVVVAEGAESVQDAVKHGSLSIREAEKIARLPKEQQPEAVKHKLKEKTTPKQRKPREPKPKADETKTVHEQASDDAHGDTDTVAFVEFLQKENDRLRAEIEAMKADDTKVEIAKWQRLAHVAQQRQGELMDSAQKSQERERWTMNQLRRCGKVVNEDDPRRIAAVVETLIHRAGVAA